MPGEVDQVLVGCFTPSMGSGYSDATYGDRIAEIYDERYLESFRADTDAAVSFLRPLAAGGPVLELGIGTGRVAVPLSRQDVEVRGIDASQAMVDKLHAKDASIAVTIGSFADFDLEERFPLVYVVFNTFFGLLSQDEQVSSFAAVARHLTRDGVFVMQAFVPDVTRFDAHNQRTAVESLGVDRVDLAVSEHDPFSQRTATQHVILTEAGVRLYPVRIRYAYPSELDLMARLAGLRLRERWSDWDRSAYPARNWQHVSVWERAEA